MSVQVNTPPQPAHTVTLAGPTPNTETLPESCASAERKAQTTNLVTESTHQHREKDNSSSDGSFRDRRNSHGHHTNPTRKRRYSHRGGYQANRFSKRHKSQMILPSKFLLGGNIRDPLNLNGLSESDEVTPVSSPLPTPASHRDVVNVIIPPNITDPLNLVCSDDDANDELFENLAIKQRKKKRKKEVPKELNLSAPSVKLGPLNIEIDSDVAAMPAPARRSFGNTISPVIDKDKIVSPVIPQKSPKAWKKRRTSSESGVPTTTSITSTVARSILKDDTPSTATSAVSPKLTKLKRQHSGQKPHRQKKKHESKFMHGNYNRYYGYRNPNAEEDCRLKHFERIWFEDKDVLDVGCNTGHVTLNIAKDFQPSKIVGVDIDPQLISIARKNIRHYLLGTKFQESTKHAKETAQFPASMEKCFGPICDAAGVDLAASNFPQNVFFRQGDFVLESDELLDLQKPEYDVILALSITKWIHLNHGDAGLKRTFKRFFRMLRPGGKLILEPQGWPSYGKRKKLSDAIFKNYHSIRMRPDQFQDFLLSRHVGFKICYQLSLPFNKSKGFRRPIHVYTKPAPSPEYAMVRFESPMPLPSHSSLTDLRPEHTPGSYRSGHSTPWSYSGSFDGSCAKYEISASNQASPFTPRSCTSMDYEPQPSSVENLPESPFDSPSRFRDGTNTGSRCCSRNSFSNEDSRSETSMTSSATSSTASLATASSTASLATASSAVSLATASSTASLALAAESSAILCKLQSNSSTKTDENFQDINSVSTAGEALERVDNTAVCTSVEDITASNVGNAPCNVVETPSNEGNLSRNYSPISVEETPHRSPIIVNPEAGVGSSIIVNPEANADSSIVVNPEANADSSIIVIPEANADSSIIVNQECESNSLIVNSNAGMNSPIVNNNSEVNSPVLNVSSDIESPLAQPNGHDLSPGVSDPGGGGENYSGDYSTSESSDHSPSSREDVLSPVFQVDAISSTPQNKNETSPTSSSTNDEISPVR